MKDFKITEFDGYSINIKGCDEEGIETQGFERQRIGGRCEPVKAVSKSPSLPSRMAESSLERVGHHVMLRKGKRDSEVFRAVSERQTDLQFEWYRECFFTRLKVNCRIYFGAVVLFELLLLNYLD